MPLWFGGVSEAAIPVGAKHADTYALFGEPRSQVTELMALLQHQAATNDRRLSFNLSFRPILGDTEGAAWDKARSILAGVEASTPKSRGISASGKGPEAETARRLTRLIEGGEIQDECLWVPIAAAVQGSGNTTALVGTPDQVAEAIAKYYKLGVSGVLIRGFEPFDDAIHFGEELIPLIREKVERVDQG